MHSFIAAMARQFPATLAITLGHPAMIGLGPIGGYTVETGIAITSNDPLAADVVGAQLLGFTYRGVHHLWEVARLAIGEYEIEKMDFPVLNMDRAFAAFTKAAYGRELQLEHA
jgi:uncharacterized protein (DUF362 family)